MRTIHVLGILSVLFTGALLCGAQVAFAPASSASNVLAWDAVEKTVNLSAMTNIARMVFWVTNVSSEEVTIVSTDTSCDCTIAEAAKKLPWKIAPADSGALNVRVNTKGRYGVMDKSVTVFTSHGTQELGIHVKIPLTPAPYNISARQKDVNVAKADRQAVFRDHCAACHTWPAGHQTGENLFQAACGICHVSAHRADFVPDLAAIPHPTDADFWRGMVSHGKPGTLMPAFATAEGGILDANQIESLVDYLVKNYPSRGHGSFGPPAATDYLLQTNN